MFHLLCLVCWCINTLQYLLLIRGHVIQTAYKCYLSSVAQHLQPDFTVSTIITMVVKKKTSKY